MLACTWPAVRHVDTTEHAATVDAFLGHWKGTAETAQALKGLGRISVPAAHWGLGLAYVHFNNRTGQGVNFLCGETSDPGIPALLPDRPGPQDLAAVPARGAGGRRPRLLAA